MTTTTNPYTLETRRKRAAQLNAQNFTRTHCVANLTRSVPCNTPLQSRFLDGKTVPFCPTCDRKRNGRCVRCATARVAGTVGLAIYCADCKRLANAEAMARYRETHRSKLRAEDAVRRLDPEVIRDRAEYGKLYRQSRPRKTRANARAEYQRNREKRIAAHAAYRLVHRERLNAARRAHHAGTLPVRFCLSCPTVMTGRLKRCLVCVEALRRSAREAIAARLAGRLA